MCLDDLVVNTTYGLIRGALTSNTRYFTSIPYAAPPVNELRFSDPIEPIPWNDNILNTTSDPPGCVQICSSGIYCPLYTSEDCLFLNVFTPWPLSNNSNDTNSLLSVNVFIHGGAWLNGYSSPNTVFNATNFVINTNSIVVSINYRVNVFGLFYHPSFPTQFAGNYGIKDTIFALKWVKNNIRNFGGDSHKVTLFGNAIGSGSIAILSTMEINDLFQSVVIMSNPFCGAPLRTINTWGQIPDLILKYTNCTSDDADIVVQCMKAINSSDLLDAMSRASTEARFDDNGLWLAVQWTPTIGTGLIEEQPLIAFKNGNFNKDISYLIGISTFETLGLTFGKFTGLSTDYNSFTIYLEQLLDKTSADKILEHYGLPINITDVRYPPYAAMISTYGRYICPTRSIALAIDSYIDKPNQIYFFYYNYIYSFASKVYPSSWLPYCQQDGVCHNAEVPLVWNSPNTNNYNLTDNELNLSYSLQTYIANLIKTVENDEYLLWEPFNSINQNIMLFNNGSSMEIISLNDNQDCLLWDELNYKWLPQISHSNDDEDEGLPTHIIILLVVVGIAYYIFIVVSGICCLKAKRLRTSYQEL